MPPTLPQTERWNLLAAGEARSLAPGWAGALDWQIIAVAVAERAYERRRGAERPGGKHALVDAIAAHPARRRHEGGDSLGVPIRGEQRDGGAVLQVGAIQERAGRLAIGLARIERRGAV